MGRHRISPNLAWAAAYTTVAYVADALELAGQDGDKEAGALARPLEDVLGRWEHLDKERRAKKRGVGRAQALVKRRDMQADERTRDVHRDTLHHVSPFVTSSLRHLVGG